LYLNQTAEYALRAAARLARLEDGASMSGHELADETGVPIHYLSKLLRKMVVAELLVAQKGHGGGFRLARPASQIRLRDVLVAVEFPLDPDHCVFGHQECDPTHPCPLHAVWNRLNCAVLRWAEGHTLADTTLDGASPPLPKLDDGP
jgi:Rrf2 family protein